MEALAGLELVEFALILEDGSGMVYDDVAREKVESQRQGCGCFWVRKPLAA